MRQKPGTRKSRGEQVVKGIRRATRKQYSAEEKIRIVLDGLRGEDSIAEPCRREGFARSLYYSWSKEFLEAGKKRLAGDTARAAASTEVRLRLTGSYRPGGRGVTLLQQFFHRAVTWLQRNGDLGGSTSVGDFNAMGAMRCASTSRPSSLASPWGPPPRSARPRPRPGSLP